MTNPNPQPTTIEPIEDWDTCVQNSLKRAIHLMSERDWHQGDVIDRHRLSELLTRLQLDESTMEPFRVGNTYQTQDGSIVTLLGYGDDKMKDTTYETMYDQHGHHRYTNRGTDSGRGTGSAHDFSSGTNIQPLYRRPPPYAVPPLAVLIPEGYKILRDTKWEERNWLEDEPSFGHYSCNCFTCGREYKGDKRGHLCRVCSREEQPKLFPTAIVTVNGPSHAPGPELRIIDRDYIAGEAVGHKERSFRPPVEPRNLTDPQLVALMASLTTELARRHPTNGA